MIGNILSANLMPILKRYPLIARLLKTILIKFKDAFILKNKFVLLSMLLILVYNRYKSGAMKLHYIKTFENKNIIMKSGLEHMVSESRVENGEINVGICIGI